VREPLSGSQRGDTSQPADERAEHAITRAAASPAEDGYTTIAVVYTSPAGEQLLGGWGTGGDPASDTVMQVFPLDDVTASHTVVMIPRMDIVAAAGAGSSDATACLG
jgi:hypothetical protein